jgi:ABC-type glutathione transport system ATPase component
VTAVLAPVVRVSGLTVTHPDHDRPVVDRVDFETRPGEIVGLVGESGSGKSVTCLSLVGLAPRGMRVSGSIAVADREIVDAPARTLRQVRSTMARVVFQDPWTTLNPTRTVGAQLTESARLSGVRSRAEAYQRSVDALSWVGVADPSGRMRSRPRQLSGGIAQRVVIAMGVLAQPQLLICDEPTTALDATTEIQVLDLLRRLCTERSVSVLLTTHDLSIASMYTDRLVVLYRGRVVESGPSQDVLTAPQHQYTQGLVAAVPKPDAPARTRLPVAAGQL